MVREERKRLEAQKEELLKEMKEIRDNGILMYNDPVVQKYKEINIKLGTNRKSKA